METKFNFNSQICSTREQSGRLLALGLKKETADCCHRNNSLDGKPYTTALFVGKHSSDIPAWSLHRLIEMVPEIIDGIEKEDEWYPAKSIVYEEGSVKIIDLDAGDSCKSFHEGNIYDSIISCIEWLINEGYFNKEYLV